MASAILSPTSWSEFAEIVPTCANALVSSQGTESFSISSTTAATALSTPRLRSIGFIPAATDLRPSLRID